jgi:hypothetical protein
VTFFPLLLKRSNATKPDANVMVIKRKMISEKVGDIGPWQ